jgi:hypothetical protein
MVLMTSPLAPRPQGRFNAELAAPLRRPDRLGKPEMFELARSANQQSAELRILPIRAGSQVDKAGVFVGDVAKRSVEVGPAFGLDFLLEALVNPLLGSRTELKRNALSRASLKPFADVITADDEVPSVPLCRARGHGYVGCRYSNGLPLPTRASSRGRARRSSRAHAKARTSTICAVSSVERMNRK